LMGTDYDPKAISRQRQNEECRMQNAERASKAARSHPKARHKPSASQEIGRWSLVFLLCSSCAPLVLPLTPREVFGGTAAVSPSPCLGLTALPCPLFKCNRIFLTGFLSLAAGHLRQATPRDRNLAATIQLRKAPLNRRDAMSAEKRAGDKPLKPITFQWRIFRRLRLVRLCGHRVSAVPWRLPAPHRGRLVRCAPGASIPAGASRHHHQGG
jgi:hypothetical protein